MTKQNKTNKQTKQSKTQTQTHTHTHTHTRTQTNKQAIKAGGVPNMHSTGSTALQFGMEPTTKTNKQTNKQTNKNKQTKTSAAQEWN